MDTAIELEIGRGPEPGTYYVVRVLRSVGGGEPVETITLDVDELVSQRPHVEASILSSSVSTRRIMSDTEAAVQGAGVRLFDATFSGDEAVRSGRIGILGLSRGTLEWMTPVLYLRGEDTHLFDIAPLPEAPAAPARLVRRKAWLIAAAIGIVADGGGVAAALLLRPDGGVSPNGNGQGNGGQPVMTEVTVPVDKPWTEGLKVGPEGLISGLYGESRVASSEYTAALLGTLDTVDEPFCVGYAATYVCPVGGRLSLGVNDNSLDGNTGNYWAAVTHRPTG